MWWMNFNSLDRMSVHSQPMGVSTRNPESSYTTQATEAQVAWCGPRLDSVAKKIPKHWKNLKFLKSLRTGDVPTAPVTVHLIHKELLTAGRSELSPALLCQIHISSFWLELRTVTIFPQRTGVPRVCFHTQVKLQMFTPKTLHKSEHHTHLKMGPY